MNVRLKTLLSLNLIAMLAVIAVIAGPPAYAKGRALITGADVQDSSLTGADVQNGTLAGSDIADGSVAADKLDASTARMPSETYTVTDERTVAPGATAFGVAGCRDANDEIINGGYSTSGLYTELTAFANAGTDAPDAVTGPDNWAAGVRNTGSEQATFLVIAICRVVD